MRHLKIVSCTFAAALAVSLAAMPSLAADAASSEAEVADSLVESVAEPAEEAVRPNHRGLDFITLGDYKGLEITAEPIEITEDQISQTMNAQISASDAAYDSITDGSVEQGDTANIDYIGKKDDVAFDGGTAEGYDLEIGSGTFIPGFEEGLVGAVIGESVDLNLTFPEDYGNTELAGADVVFTVKVNSVKRPKEVTDDLVKDITGGEANTIDEYKDLTKLRMEESARTSQISSLKSELLNKAADNAAISEYPEDLMSYTENEIKEYYEYYASMYGMDLDTFMQYMVGGTIEDIAKNSIRQEFLVDAIAETENLIPEGDDLAAAFDELASRIGVSDGEALLTIYDENTIISTIAYEKVSDFLYDNAVITMASPAGTDSDVESIVEVMSDVETVAAGTTSDVEDMFADIDSFASRAE